MSGVTFDAGALIEFERGNRQVLAIVARLLARGERIAVPTPVIAQVWRDGRTQGRLARLLGSRVVELVVLDDLSAREAGQLCGARNTRDIVDASVVRCARGRGHAVVTTDPDDLRLLEPRLTLIEL